MNPFDLIITKPMGFVIEHIYGFVQNYGLAIILFTILIKLVVLPLTAKSQKAMKKQQKIQPIVAELQKKYANDQQKLQAEMMKVYKDNGVSMTGGCLPMLIQMPILIGLYQVIQKPLSYLAGVNFNAPEAINKVIDLQAVTENIGNLKTATMQQLADTSQIQLSKWSEVAYGTSDPWVINFNFLGMDLSNSPMVAVSAIAAGDFGQWSILSLLLIPILAIVSTWFVSKLPQWQQKRRNGGKKVEDATTQMTNTMTLMMPIMTGFFTFTLPSGLGIYWIISNIAQIVQQVSLDMYFDKKEDDFVVKIPEKNRKNRKKRK